MKLPNQSIGTVRSKFVVEKVNKAVFPITLVRPSVTSALEAVTNKVLTSPLMTSAKLGRFAHTSTRQSFGFTSNPGGNEIIGCGLACDDACCIARCCIPGICATSSQCFMLEGNPPGT